MALLVWTAKEPLQRRVDELWVYLLHLIESVAQPVHGSRAEILNDYICFTHKFVNNISSLFQLDIYSNRSFIAIVERVVADAEPSQPTGSITRDRLNPDDVGAHISENYTAGRPHNCVGEF